MNKTAFLAATLAALSLASAARAQAPVDQLPPDPGLLPDPAREVVAPEDPGDAGQIAAPVADTGPTFVLRGIELDGAVAVPLAELEPIWADLIGQDVTLATLDEIATRIGAAYRVRGYVLSQAVLPAQTVDGGVVRIIVVEGFIDQVAIEGGADNQQRVANRLFGPVPDERPLRLQTLERAVLLSRDTFGGSVETVLEPAPETFGAADLGVLVEPERPTGFATIDNRGSRLYGTWTLGGGGRSYNLLGLNERLDALVVYTPGDNSLAFGSVIFDAPLEPLYGTFLDGGRLELGANASRADPDLAKSGSPQDLTTILNQKEVSARLIVPFIRTRSQNLFGWAGLTFRESVSETGFGASDAEETDRLAMLDLRGTWDVADRAGGVNLVDASLRQGLDIGNAEVATTGPAAGNTTFTSLRLDLSRLQSLGSSRWALWGEVISQYAANVLPSSERFFLGNATIGRGFAPGNTSGDSGFGTRLELRRYLVSDDMRGAIDAAELYAFADYGRAFDRAIERDGDQWQTLSSVGIGARIDVRPWLSITPEIARQTDGIPTDTTDPNLETRAYIGAIARF